MKNKKSFSVEANHIGYEIYVDIRVTLWGGGTGKLHVKKIFIPYGEFTKERFLKSIHDDGFGCESIDAFNAEIFNVYEIKEFDDNIILNYNRTITCDDAIKYNKFFKRGI